MHTKISTQDSYFPVQHHHDRNEGNTEAESRTAEEQRRKRRTWHREKLQEGEKQHRRKE